MEVRGATTTGQLLSLSPIQTISTNHRLTKTGSNTDGMPQEGQALIQGLRRAGANVVLAAKALQATSIPNLPGSQCRVSNASLQDEKIRASWVQVNRQLNQ